MKEGHVLVTSSITIEDRQKFKEVAQYRGQSMTGVLRQWIRKAHKQQEKQQ